MINNFITEVRQRQAEQASTLIAFTNKSSILGHYNFIGLKNQLVAISTQKRSTDKIFIDGGHMMHVLQAHDLPPSKLQIDRTNTMNRSMRSVPHQHGGSPCSLIRGKHGNISTNVYIGTRVNPPFRRMTY